MQSFRSPSGLNAGILDPEFEAFQAGHPPPPQAFAGPSNLPEWAADFQRLNPSSQAPFQPQDQRAPQYNPRATLEAAGSSPWHQEFLQQHPATQQPSHRQDSRNVFSKTPQFLPQLSGMARFAPSHDQTAPQGHAHPRQQHVYDDAAFTKAFDAIGLDIAEPLGQQEQSIHLATQAESERLRDAEDTRNAAAELHGRFEAQRVMQQAGVPMTENGLPTFEENITPVSQQDEHQQQEEKEKQQEQTQKEINDDDELAATAGRLLESVADNQSAKFGNSKFLELMRKLRDKEVRVKGDKMVDVNEAGQSHVNEVNQGTVNAVDQGAVNEVSQLSNEAHFTLEAGKEWDWQQDRTLSLDLAGLKRGRTVLFDDFVTCFGVPRANGEPHLNGAIVRGP